MNYIPRDIDSVLIEWAKEPHRKPLLLRGVRQCGKTSAVRKLSSEYPNYLEINFEKQQSLHSVFAGDLDAKRILARLELETGIPIIPGKTLIFLDEIQVCPRAISALRYFYEETPEIHVIAAGSLLEFVLNKTAGFPVGRVRSVYMYPLSFMEFLSGMGYQALRDWLENLDYRSDSNEMHPKLLELYKTFMIVGGMPEAVADFIQNQSFLSCQRIHRDIIQNFYDDFGKYDSRVSAEIIRKVFEYSLHNVCSQTKASSAINGVSAYYFDEALKLLYRAGLVFPVLSVPCDTLALGASAKQSNKKLLFFDSGIYLTECKLDAGTIIGAEVFDSINRGDAAELQTGLEIIKYSDSYSEPGIFYWYRSGANAEVDYVLPKGDRIIPVEVKASVKGGMQSIHSYLETHPDVPYGIRISMESFSEYENIHVFPLYAVKRIL